MASIAIVGAGQSGLHLGIGLIQAGHDVTILSNRTGADLARGTVLSSQSMYGMALGLERELGIDFWQEDAPKYEGASMRIADSQGSTMLHWEGQMDEPGQSIDQRVKMPQWMAHFEKIGGKLVIADVGVDRLEELTQLHDLVVVASGKGEIASLFARDETRSPYAQPMRVLALTYVKPIKKRPGGHAISININPGIGEFVTFPGLTLNGACDIFTIECVPGGPMDVWQDVRTPAEHVELSEHLLRTYFPHEAQRLEGSLALTDDKAVLRGRVAPTVRHPVGRLPSGRSVVGLADVVVLNDPITGQGSNNASKAAKIYLDAIVERGDGPFDDEWKQQVFERYWGDYAQWATRYTNMTLGAPPEHMLRILKTAEANAGLAHILANSFNDPKSLAPWYYDANAADSFLTDLTRVSA